MEECGPMGGRKSRCLFLMKQGDVWASRMTWTKISRELELFLEVGGNARDCGGIGISGKGEGERSLANTGG